MLLGDQARSMVSLPQFTAIDQAVSLTLLESRHVGEDLKLRYRVNNSAL